MDLVIHETGLCSEMCHASSGEVIGIKVEEKVINIKEEEEEEIINVKEEEVLPEPIIFPVIKTEDEVSCMSVCLFFCSYYRC
jgi:hypothetical protein